MSVLSINQVAKNYGPVRALKGVSFDIPPGSVFGILGPNGSGKTTMLGIVMDVLKATSGTYQWLDNAAPEAARRQIGCLLETPNFYHYLSAEENLKITAAIKRRGADDIERVLGIVGLLQRKDSKFSTYSLGMKQRLAIGAALLGGPKVLVLDEPTNGLDPEGIAEIRELIRSLSKEGITVIMASHLLDEVERVCSHVAILKQGTLLVTGAVDDVLRSEEHVEVQAADMTILRKVLGSMPGVGQLTEENGLLQLSGSVNAAVVNQYCATNGIYLSHLAVKKRSLESRFIELTAN